MCVCVCVNSYNKRHFEHICSIINDDIIEPSCTLLLTFSSFYNFSNFRVFAAYFHRIFVYEIIFKINFLCSH